MTKKTGDLERAKKVLDYWYAIEFLAQDKYDDMWETRTKMKKAQNDFAKGKFKGKTVWSYRELQNSQSIYDIVSADAISCGMKKWGNITIYIGKIKREACIKCISKILPGAGREERPEKAYDSIAWASLQIAPDGTYVEHSLSLSTIIWSINQLKSGKGSLSERIDEQQYRSTVDGFEERFFSKEQGLRQSSEDEEIKSENLEGEEDHFQEFAPDAVTVKTLKALYKRIEKDFISGNIESEEDGQEHQEVYGLYFQLFADEKSKNKMDEENYLGLSHDYFSEDIKFVLREIENDILSPEEDMGADLIRYISALGENDDDGNIDLIDPKNKRKFLQQVSEILEVGNAPLGKWPSKFMPAFMQQVAVNLCIKKGTSELYGINGKIFSVNGPPGTGKTTLLKEIVVSNIIERAVLLAKYSDPDNAFEKHSFLRGEKQENAYSSFTRGWYSLKNDKINNYSTLVASCNNAAVENVSKELPLSTNIINDLKPGSEDTKEYALMLDELSKLFDPAQSQIYETVSKKSRKDIYFTEYAKELFGSDSVWGLIAAPLGKRANISAFYNRVLAPLHWDFYPGKDFKDARLEKYKYVKGEFQKQLKTVEKLQKRLKAICALVRERRDLAAEHNEIEIKLPKMRAEHKEQVEKGGARIDELNEKLAECTANAQKALRKRNELQEDVSKLESEVSVWSARARKLSEEKAAMKRKKRFFNFFDKVFNNKKAGLNEKLIEEYQNEQQRADAEIIRLKDQLEMAHKSLKEAETKLNDSERVKESAAEALEEEKFKAEKIERQIHKLEREVKRIKTELDEKESIYLNEVKAFTQEESLDTGLVLDEAFTDSLLSQDMEESAAAQVSNPWFTKRYNIERGKLFYHAMRLNKEFVLSSKSCRDNFKTLGHYWGMLLGDDKERIAFHRDDKERFVGALYQTLFLLVPVLSSTFASLGTFLRDARQPGIIGTLIVDEAGQAQPQMAVGALYRSRRAVIVGDPKQVEPVVTDDLDMLKRAFNDEALRPYKAKTISVQSFADKLNSFGTYFDNGTDYPEWVGCPLLVHRRCISPMYDISNEISYNGIMKQQTREPDAEKAASFVYDRSQWINVTGREKGNKNHFVEEQAQMVCEILEQAFSKSDDPSLYIISPFASVIKEMKAYIKEYKREAADTNLSRCKPEWISKNIGTVHTFQGKEANEVVFLLGCDKSKEAQGAVKWVNANIVNVAATRAKFRLYVIGDEEAWQDSSCVRKAKNILDTFAIKKIKDILNKQLPKEEEAKALASASMLLPPITSFQREPVENGNGEIDCSVNTSSLLQGLPPIFMSTSFSEEQLRKFGFQSMEELRELALEVQENLLLGMKLFYLLSPVYEVTKKLDASCCAVLFCKALESQMKDCFEDSLKAIFPDEKIRGQGKGRGAVKLKDARSKELTLGAFHVLLKAKSSELGRRMELKGKKEYDMQWWSAFEAKLLACNIRRNTCCHAGLFSWKDQSYLLADMFTKGKKEAAVQIEGILFESRIGKELQ